MFQTLRQRILVQRSIQRTSRCISAVRHTTSVWEDSLECNRYELGLLRSLMEH